MKLKYDAKADRMRLVMEREDQPPRVFWLKRNQCLAWLARLSDLARQLGVEISPIELGHQPPRAPRKNPVIDAMIPQDLDGIRMRPDEDGVRVIFVQARDGMAMNLTVPGMLRLQEMLLTQAERVGWDPVAGLQRLAAMAAAQAAIDKSKDDGR